MMQLTASARHIPCSCLQTCLAAFPHGLRRAPAVADLVLVSLIRVKQTPLLLIVTLLLAAAPCSTEAKAPPQVLQDLVTADLRHVVTRVSDFPAPIRRAFASALRQRKLFISDAGQPFQDTDFIIVEPGHKSLPTRRLRFAFRTNRFFIVHYEAGGYESAAKTLVFSYPKSGLSRYMWGGVDWNPSNTPAELIRQIHRNKVMDDLPYIW
ncbi:MAG TPA: hypothetical protein VGW39_11745 [Chthoniobacterales bacterium]|nr:hypothetical protein [Chthoniobacterales bacterium]